MLATLFVITALLGLFISNTATAVLMAPVALAVAQRSRRLALSVRDDRGARRLDRVHDAGLVAGEHAGGRCRATTRFGDFVRVGLPFSVVVLVVCVLLAPLLLPLQ